MAISPHFFNKRETETSPARHVVPTPGGGGGYGASSNAVNSAVAAPPVTSPVNSPAPVAEGGSKLTVGPNIKLKGVEITDCDTLLVEGMVEATMDSRVIQISERGAFKGSAEVDIAEIHGQFDGNLTVRQKLIIYATGKVTGKVRYGKVVIEEGGQLTGEIQYGAVASSKTGNVEKSGLSLAG
jgi:cytoskeletal protein CcmA (bactofilin family)